MKRSRGHAVVELCLFTPWIYFLFVGALDFGFYSYALIAVQNAARAAALNAAMTPGMATDQAQACEVVLGELARMPNASTFGGGCSGQTLQVELTRVRDAEARVAARVQVSYRTIRLLSIPGLVPNQMTIVRTAEVPIYGS